MSDSDALLLGSLADGAELVRLAGIECRGHHGVHPHERRDGQRFVVDVTLHLARPARTDDLATTVDYGALAAAVAEDVASDPVDLIETLAGRLAERCLADPHVAGVAVTVHKPDAPMSVVVRDASVTVVRARA